MKKLYMFCFTTALILNTLSAFDRHPLHRFVVDGDVEKVEEVLKLGCDVQTYFHSGLGGPFALTVSQCKKPEAIVPIIRLFQHAGADVRQVNVSGETVLHDLANSFFSNRYVFGAIKIVFDEKTDRKVVVRSLQKTIEVCLDASKNGLIFISQPGFAELYSREAFLQDYKLHPSKGTLVKKIATELVLRLYDEDQEINAHAEAEIAWLKLYKPDVYTSVDAYLQEGR